MSVSPEILDAALERVAAFCRQHSTDDHRIEHSVRGASITIVERRPPWSPAFGHEWSSTKIAQLRYDDRANRWRLYCSDSNQRWHPYEFARPAAGVMPLLAAVDQDRTGIFWG